MINAKEISKDIWWIGGSDRRLAKFENLFPLPNGVSYNSYLVMDEKKALFQRRLVVSPQVLVLY